MANYEIPLSGVPETFSITLNGTAYRLTTQYRDNALGGWFLDIADAGGNSIISGIAMVAGVNLLGQYDYIGVAASGALYLANSAGGDDAPKFDNLGTDTHLVLVAP